MSAAVLAIGGAVVAVAVAGIVYKMGYDAGEASVSAKQKAVDDVAQAIDDKVQRTVAGAIAGIKVNHTTIRQRAEREVQTNTVYRSADCQHSPDQLQRLNAALANRPEGAVAAGGVELPASSAAR